MYAAQFHLKSRFKTVRVSYLKLLFLGAGIFFVLKHSLSVAFSEVSWYLDNSNIFQPYVVPQTAATLPILLEQLCLGVFFLHSASYSDGSR